MIRISELLYSLLIKPIILLFEVLFSMVFKAVPIPLVALTVMSLAVNILVLPLYKRADEIQKLAGEMDKAVRPMADHIRKTFKGDEKVMMLQTYYNEMKYSPLEPLKSSVSLLLQIPFFIAAYNMISGLAVLNGSSAGPIKDLGQPDAMFSIGSFSVNILPILMTVINLISCLVVVKGKSLKDKLQLFITAGVFLVLLYNSPAGLVYYWTCNNIFSLIKNIVLLLVDKKKKKKKENAVADPVYNKIFVLNALIMSIFVGMSIPSDLLVRAAPDMLRIDHYVNPALYLFYSLAIALGLFLVWFGIYFALSSKKKIISGVMVILTLVMLFDYFGQYAYYGDMTRYLTFVFATVYSADPKSIAMTVLVTLCIGMLVFIVIKHRPQLFVWVSIPILLALVVFSSVNYIKVDNVYRASGYASEYNVKPKIDLSTEGKNVVVIMLDRAQGALIPYILNEREELQDEFDGFVYYRNCISFGAHTNLAFPAMFGGYDYTPDAINARDDISLMDKHNEALLMLPVLFEENGYEVTVCDPPYANYMEIPDLSIYDEYPNIDAYNTYTAENPYSEQLFSSWDSIMKRDLFFYGLMNACPEFARKAIYDQGLYNEPNMRYEDRFVQRIKNYSVASGVNSEYVDSIHVLEGLSDMTCLNDQSEGCFLFLANNATHSAILLDERDYSLSFSVDNTEFDRENASRFEVDGNSLPFNNINTMAHYQSSVASYLALADWFDYLRECGVYDNTRIIIVADHGGEMYLGPESMADDGFLTSSYNPVLLVKDFDSHGFTVSDDFMTNAETPYIATNGIIEDPINPFTGNPIRTIADVNDDLIVTTSNDHLISENNGNTFLPGSRYRLNDREDPLNYNSWEYVGEW